MVKNEKQMRKHYEIMRKNNTKTDEITALIEQNIKNGTMYRLK